MRNALVRNLEGKSPLGGPSCRWKDNIKMCIKDSCGWVNVAQVRVQWWAVVKAVLN
jgi:hypothetical protein